jgi:hypothetical protein
MSYSIATPQVTQNAGNRAYLSIDMESTRYRIRTRVFSGMKKARSR